MNRDPKIILGMALGVAIIFASALGAYLIALAVIVLDQLTKAWVLASLPEYTAIPVSHKTKAFSSDTVTINVRIERKNIRRDAYGVSGMETLYGNVSYRTLRCPVEI